MKELQLGGKRGGVALIDDDDFALVSGYSWYRSKNGYAQSAVFDSENHKWRGILMHRVILGLNDHDRCTDHINRLRLDNRRSNLREASKQQNAHNLGLSPLTKSGYRGVFWHKTARRWCARAKLKGLSYFLGYFDTPEEANLVVGTWRAQHMSHAVELICDPVVVEEIKRSAKKRLSRNNTSGYRGVFWNKARRHWQAHVTLSGRRHYLGSFNASEAAGAAVENWHASRTPISREAQNA